MTLVDANFEWFRENVEQIKREHKVSDNEYLVISNKKIVKKFSNYYEAIVFAEENFNEIGYIIQKLSDLDSKHNSFGFLGTQFHA